MALRNRQLGFTVFNLRPVCFQEENEKKALKEPSDTEPASADRYTMGLALINLA